MLCVYRRAHMSRRLSVCAITDGKRFRSVDACILARMLQHNTVLTTLDLGGMCEAAMAQYILHTMRV